MWQAPQTLSERGAPRATDGRFRDGRRRVRSIVAIAALVVVALLALSMVRGGTTPASHSELRVAAVVTDATAVPGPALSLDTTVTPLAICALQEISCPAEQGIARVQLSASPEGGPVATWPAVQIVFVIETTGYDGVLGTDRSDQLDECANASPTAPACEESNGVPFFVANAQEIANAIQGANPHSAVSFALVDYYDARGEPWDDADGPEYNVDIGAFVPANLFGGLVVSTFQQSVMNGLWYSWDQDLDNAFLDTSSITALYGAITGSQLDWANDAHHVIVWMGSSAPRDPNYEENYCVSPSEWNVWDAGLLPCDSESCEPSYIFVGGVSPECEGWVQSQDGNPDDSIAALAHHSPSCTDSVGGVCTIDMIDLWTTPTDPYSLGWPAQFSNIGGGPGGPVVQEDVAKIIQAGCDLAAATGGSWSGPAFESCPNGVAGDLQYVPFGDSIDTPNTNNPSLFDAFRSIGFGPVYGTEVAVGTGQPIFQYVAFGNIQVAPTPEWAAVCALPTGLLRSCQETPTVLHKGDLTYFGWNWSTVAADNSLFLGDSWSAAFDVVAAGPPYAFVPVDACTTVDCRAAGSGAVDGAYTLATYLGDGNTTVVTTSFPLAEVKVETGPIAIGIPSVPPAAPPPPPALPIPIAPVSTIASPVVIVAQLGIASVSLQATAAGFLGAGFMRITLKNRPIAMAVAAKSGAVSTRPGHAGREDPRLGRME
jgi:hypothetical protein